MEEWKLKYARFLDNREKWERNVFKASLPILLLVIQWNVKRWNDKPTLMINLGLVFFSQYVIYIVTKKYVGHNNKRALFEWLGLEFLILIAFILLAGVTGGTVYILEYFVLFVSMSILIPLSCIKVGREKDNLNEVRYYYNEIKTRYGISDRGEYLTEGYVLKFRELDKELTMDVLLTWEQASKLTKEDLINLRDILHAEATEVEDEETRRRRKFQAYAEEIKRREGASAD